MLMKLNRQIAKLTVGAAVIASGSIAYSQWGTNAQPCQDGRCAPARPTWGWYKTCWSRWPGAVYPDMIGPPAKPGADQLPPGQVELPNPMNEADVQTPSATRGATRAAPPLDGAPPTGGMPDPAARNRGLDSLPAPSDFSPPDSSELRRPANTMPIEEPQFGVPGALRPAEPTPAVPRSSGIPKPRLRPGSPTAPVAVSPALGELRGQRVSWSEQNNSQQAVVHPSAASAKTLSPPTDEPELIIPSLNSRPIEAPNTSSRQTENSRQADSSILNSRPAEVPTIKSRPLEISTLNARAVESANLNSRPVEFTSSARSIEPTAFETRVSEVRGNRSGSNPLREETDNEASVGGNYEVRQASFGVRADSGSMPNAARGNPLRRN